MLINTNLADAKQLKVTLKKMGIASVNHVGNIMQFKKLFRSEKFDAIICNDEKEKKIGTQILASVRASRDEIPFVFISDEKWGKTAVKFLELGATDYLLKNNLDKLPFILSRALEEVESKKWMQGALKALEESKQKYRSVVEDQTEYIFRWLPNGEIVFANKSFLNFHNSTLGEMLKRNISDLMSQEEKKRLKRKIAQLKPSCPVFTDIHYGNHPAHGNFWHEWADRAFFDKKGKPTIYQSVGRDITVQKLAETKLAENESRFRMLVENSFDVYSICDENGKIIYCSPNVESILGYLPSDLLNSSVFDLFHPSIAKIVSDKFRELFVSDLDSHVFVHKIVSKNKKFKIFQTTGKIQKDTNGRRTIVFNSIDITEKHSAEKKLKETAEILNLVDSIVIVVKPNLDISYVSPSVNKMLGFEPKELLGRLWWEKTTMGYVFMQKEMNHMQKVFANGFGEENNYYERIVTTKEGQLKWIGWEKSMAPDGSIVGVGQDLTKKKKAELELEESKRYLATLIESIPDLLFRIDHDGKILDYKSNDGSSISIHKDGSLIGHNYLKLIPKSVVELHNLCAAEALHSGKVVSYDFEIKMPPEKSLFYETRIKSNAADELILIVRDVTERKNAEREIRKQKELLSFSHKLSKIGHYTLNLEKNALFWSEELCVLFEKNFHKTVPTFDLFFSLVHKDDLVMVKETINDIRKNPRPYELNYRILTEDGDEKHLRGTSELFENKEGEKILIGVVQDITEVKDFENALLQREKQVKRTNKLNTQIIESSDQFFYISKVNPEKIIGRSLSYASPQVEDIFGISPSEFMNDISIWHKTIHPSDFQEALVAVQEMKITKNPITLIYRIKNRVTKNYLWVEDYVFPQLDETGNIIELYGSVKNIDERKRAEVELQKRESLLRETQRIAKLGTWEWNVNEGSLSVNDEMYGIMEIDPGNFTGKFETVLDFLAPESIPVFHDSISKLQNNIMLDDIEMKIITAKGNEKKILIRVSDQRENSEGRNILHGTVLDITELWQSHQTLFATEEKFKKIFETITDVYYQVNANGTISIISPSAFLLLGYTQEELIGTSISKLYEFPEQRKGMLEILHQQGFINNFETSLKTKAGNIIYISANISLLFDLAGNPMGWQGILRDITEKRKNDLEREKLLLELTNKYNQLMQFNYIVSHNLRSPISNLLGLCKMFELPIDEQEKNKIIGYIQNSVNSMDGLVNDLNMILATRTAINENKENVLLTNIFATIKSNLRKQIDNSSALILSDIADDNNSIYTIKTYLQSILYNLVSNAIKYCAPDRKPVIRISCTKEGTNTIISVADNGNGIDLPKFETQLFGLYKRFDFSKEGRGLGLHMTKTQVEALGGEIKVESEVGKGTTFMIILPN